MCRTRFILEPFKDGDYLTLLRSRQSLERAVARHTIGHRAQHPGLRLGAGHDRVNEVGGRGRRPYERDGPSSKSPICLRQDRERALGRLGAGQVDLVDIEPSHQVRGVDDVGLLAGRAALAVALRAPSRRPRPRSLRR
jgi:hypothetical protein